MDIFSVLNYQGSKKNILDFIHSNTKDMINEDSTILDIFSGTCSVGYSFKANHCVYANDCEPFAYVIANALLNSNYISFDVIKDEFISNYTENFNNQQGLYLELSKEEKKLLDDKNSKALVEFYKSIPTVWNSKQLLTNNHKCFELFTTYYSASYFGVFQAIEIDSIRFAIEQFKRESIYFALLTTLFFSMKECVFSKDGHMAQPLSLEKNEERMIKQRSKSVYSIFLSKIKEFNSNSFVNSNKDNRVYNMNFSDLLSEPDIKENVSFIYADPPYTDMQYSRYYHLLNTVTNYNYPELTINNGSYTKGLYTNNRFQSKLSTKSNCLNTLSELLDFSKSYKKDLAISFAYPIDIKTQKTNRYVMDVNDLILKCNDVFGNKKVDVVTKNYFHSNNRNSKPKNVNEYLILCKSF